MEEIRLVAPNGEAVCQALERGEILHLDTACEEITDEFLLFAIESGLLEEWSSGFPDPRCWCQISFKVLLASSLAARFAAFYSLRMTGYVLRSARVLGALGYSPEVLEEGDGLSSYGTGDDSLFSSDVLRKLLVKLEQQAEIDLSKESKEKANQEEKVVKVRVRQRGLRRARQTRI